ncbi:unnamed protein product [Thelazia callipaeda]|uniref:Metalloendopeptidase n=1 Tax=Thelazia callipaeda TaxID=103827 RepID=A0A0N5D4L3_THECL|nr:unnamed protein product [Thelazia callipaeda]
MVFLIINLSVFVYEAILCSAFATGNNLDDLKVRLGKYCSILPYFNRRQADFETFLMPSDFAVASKLQDDDQSIDDWVIYNSGKFEGDMDIDITDLLYTDSNDDSDESSALKNKFYNAVRNRHQLWPSSRIPYALSSQYSPYSRSVIAAAMEEYAMRTCVRWVPRSIDDYDYIYIVPDRGCYSMVGRTGGKQTISLGTGCIQKGIIMHELMHAVGFFHEQSRNDRDDHISVLWENIQPGMQGQFEKYDHGIIDSLGISYDYDSIMHYGPRAFSRNGQPTLVPKIPAVIGQRLRFSNLDLLKINKLYDCPLSVNEIEIAAVTPVSEITKQQKPTDELPHLMINNSCRNIRSDCEELFTYGWCTGNPRWMKHYCPKSCNLCSNITVPSCVDQRPDCYTLMQNGHCVISDAFMQSFCPRSCGFCNLVTTNTTKIISTELPIQTYAPLTTTEAAEKFHRSKQSLGNTWRKMINNKYLKIKSTETQSTTCTDGKRFCTHWKSAGLCEGLFHSYMVENCRRSCKICSDGKDDKFPE